MGSRGPKPTQINWQEFDKLASYQATQIEIASWFNVSVDTLENASLRDHGVKLSEYFAQKKLAGKPKLRKIQYELAERGSTAMAIFLGKHLLGQSDKPLAENIVEAMNEAGLTSEAVIELIRTQSKLAQSLGKKTFVEFCATAGYPDPFDKQIDMMRFGMMLTHARLILGSRGYGKTDYVVILGIAYDIYLDATSTNLLMTKSKERNAAIISEIEKACIKNGVIFEQANSQFLRVKGLAGKDPSISAVTVKTVSLRGRHPRRIIMDDPVTEDDTSDATRRLIEKKYNELFKLCSNILIIGQPAHKFDLYAKLRGVIETLEVPHGTIPQLDHDLEAQRLAGVDEQSIQASYFLRPPTEGAVPFNNIRYLDAWPQLRSVAFIDPSHEGGDYTAISIVTTYMQGVAVVGFAFKKAWNHCLDDMAPLLKKYNVAKLAFETNALGDQPLEVLRKAFAGVGISGWRSNTNKHSRILMAGTYSHMIHLVRESNKDYTTQVVQYEYKAKNDDAPDSLASCLQWLGLIRGKE